MVSHQGGLLVGREFTLPAGRKGGGCGDGSEKVVEREGGLSSGWSAPSLGQARGSLIIYMLVGIGEGGV